MCCRVRVAVWPTLKDFIEREEPLHHTHTHTCTERMESTTILETKTSLDLDTLTTALADSTSSVGSDFSKNGGFDFGSLMFSSTKSNAAEYAKSKKEIVDSRRVLSEKIEEKKKCAVLELLKEAECPILQEIKAHKDKISSAEGRRRRRESKRRQMKKKDRLKKTSSGEAYADRHRQKLLRKRRKNRRAKPY